MPEKSEKDKPAQIEEIEIDGGGLVDTVKRVVQDVNVRRLIIKKPDGEVLLEVPLTAGVAIGGAMAVFTPVLAALGALAALLTRVKIAVVRERSKSLENPRDP